MIERRLFFPTKSNISKIYFMYMQIFKLLMVKRITFPHYLGISTRMHDSQFYGISIAETSFFLKKYKKINIIEHSIISISFNHTIQFMSYLSLLLSFKLFMLWEVLRDFAFHSIRKLIYDDTLGTFYAKTVEFVSPTKWHLK